LRPQEAATAGFIALNRQIQEANDAKRELQHKLRTIELQHRRIAELSAPIINVWDGVIMLPLIGDIDAERAATITEKLLGRIADSPTRWVILDLTGAALTDATIGEHLMRLTAAVRLVGACCVLTGLHPRLASTLVSLGITFDGLTFLQDLKEGLRYCLDGSRTRRLGEPHGQPG
jgi:rsbT co-antagonist protein RsbR